MFTRLFTSKSTLILLFICLFTLASCGGGGGSTTPTPTPTPPVDTTPPPDSVPTSLTVTALDGYLENALIYIDLNENYSFDDGEPNATTDATGTVTFTITDIAEALLKPIIVEATAGVTIDHGNLAAIVESYSMVAPPGSAVVSPLTTLAQLSLVQGQQPNIDAAISAVKTALGLDADANIMADYLSSDGENEQLYAIARSLVQLLPADATALFAQGTPQEIVTALFDSSGEVATAIIDAIAQGAEPSSLFVSIAEDGTINAQEITIEDAIAFIGDIRVWGDQINSGFLQSAADFVLKIEAAGQVAEADTTDLLELLMRYSEGGLIAVKAGLYREFNASLIVAGSTGTVTTSLNEETQIATVQINAELDGKTVVATLSTNTEEALQVTLTAILDSATVMIAVNEGSEMALDSDTFLPQTIRLNVVIDTKTNDVSTSPVHFTGLIDVETVILTDSNNDTVLLPNKMSFVGMFAVNDETFNAELHMLAEPTLVDDIATWPEFSATLQLDAQLTGVPDAHILLDVSQSADVTNLTVTLVYDERSVTLNMMVNGTNIQITATNKKGITLTIELILLQDGDALGTLTIGANQVATVSRIDGVYMVTFSDGRIEPLF
ncbi:MAG: hypothetical protein HRT35_00935 [Algicola sp.]|nr:hypothetical protein [Algicola sp.]